MGLSKETMKAVDAAVMAVSRQVSFGKLLCDDEFEPYCTASSEAVNALLKTVEGRGHKAKFALCEHLIARRKHVAEKACEDKALKLDTLDVIDIMLYSCCY